MTLCGLASGGPDAGGESADGVHGGGHAAVSRRQLRPPPHHPLRHLARHPHPLTPVHLEPGDLPPAAVPGLHPRHSPRHRVPRARLHHRRTRVPATRARLQAQPLPRPHIARSVTFHITLPLQIYNYRIYVSIVTLLLFSSS